MRLRQHPSGWLSSSRQLMSRGVEGDELDRPARSRVPALRKRSGRPKGDAQCGDAVAPPRQVRSAAKRSGVLAGRGEKRENSCRLLWVEG